MKWNCEHCVCATESQITVFEAALFLLRPLLYSIYIFLFFVLNFSFVGQKSIFTSTFLSFSFHFFFISPSMRLLREEHFFFLSRYLQKRFMCAFFHFLLFLYFPFIFSGFGRFFLVQRNSWITKNRKKNQNECLKQFLQCFKIKYIKKRLFPKCSFFFLFWF